MKHAANSYRERAVALIIVLAMLLLLSGLIVSFMTSVGNERAASVASNNEITTRQLADSTVNLVIGQIRQATTQAEAADAGRPATTWASQPGAIRTFSGTVGPPKFITTGAAGVIQFTYKSGSNDYVFKLYSAENMKVKASDIENNGWFGKETELIEKWDWAASESEREKNGQIGYTDLNTPVMSPLPSSLTKGNSTVVEPRYPIIDPRAKFLITDKINSGPDPGIVDGFDIKTKNLTDTNLKTLAGEWVQYLPMPVKWLYVMRNGAMAAADSAGKIAGASLENPIVGRIAFWTDDESCKLNINTASEGTFWDTPTASSVHVSGNVDDSNGNLSTGASVWSLNLAASQPGRGEYNRYPGHPATTCLSPALGWMGIGSTNAATKWGFMPTDSRAPFATRDPLLVNTKEAILQLAPFSPNWIQPTQRIGATSRSGSYNPDYWMPPGLDDIPRLNVVTKRLYTTVDEMIFKATRNDGTLKKPTPLNNEFVTPEKLEKVRFFLTANSRAPEMNLFGRPRVTFWPVNTDVEQRTGFDDLFAFTSTLYKSPNGNRNDDNTFYFTRWDAKSATNDYDKNPPGVPNLPDNKNPKIMDYLRLMTGSGPFPTIPGFGGCFLNKYTDAEREEILNLIFDYCRSVNLVDTSKRVRDGVDFHPYTPFFGAAAGYGDTVERSNDWSGQVTPGRINNSNYQGLGRFPTLSEVALVFYRHSTNSMRAALLFEMTTPMAGYPALRETFWTRVTVERPTLATLDGSDPAVDKVKSDIHLIGPRGTSRVNIVNISSHDINNGRSYTPCLGFANQLFYNEEGSDWTDLNDTSRPKPPTGAGSAGKKKIFNNTDAATVNYQRYKTVTFYPYVSDIIATSANASTLTFRGGAYTVEIFAGEGPGDPWGNDNEPVQKIHITFPEQNPLDPPDQIIGQMVAVPFGAGSAPLDSRLDAKKTGNWNILNNAQDVIRSLEYVGAREEGALWVPLTGDERGDFRLLMAMREVPPVAYQPRGGIGAYLSKTYLRVHGLQVGHCDPYGPNGDTTAAPGAGYLGANNATGPAPADQPARGTFAARGRNRDSKPAILPVDVNGVKRSDGGPGDWDRGLSKHNDGALGNKVDEGNIWFDYSDNVYGGKLPYYRGRGIEETGRSFFSPNRQLASAVMFGSLPTGVVRNRPWQTLLFRPNRGSKSHPGAQTVSNPADHLLLDLFNLPVVEPYAISEPFSTAGKVNLNYVIAPFGYARGDPVTPTRKVNNISMSMPRSYLRRDTALRGIFKAVKIMAVPTEEAQAGHGERPLDYQTPYHFDIDAERTLDQFESRMKDPARGLFRSASEICDMDLYPMVNGPGGPAVPPVSDWAKFWDTDYAQTGDNMRERPYAHIYPRVTTKSNVFTIHMRCQAVKKVPGPDPDKFDAKRDKVLGEYRGQATVERFIDPNDPQLKDYDATSGNSSVDPFYRFRVISTKQFLPR